MLACTGAVRKGFMWTWKQSRAVYALNTWMGRERASMCQEAQRSLSESAMELGKSGNTKIVLQNFIRISKGLGRVWCAFFPLYPGDFVACIAMPFSGYFCFLKAEELSFLWLPMRAAPAWKSLRGEGSRLWGEVHLSCSFSDRFLETSQYALVCVVDRITRWSHNLHDPVLWSISAFECDLLLAHKYVNLSKILS